MQIYTIIWQQITNAAKKLRSIKNFPIKLLVCNQKEYSNSFPVVLSIQS